MPRLLSLSRAARLVGTTRGKLQKQVQNGEIASFEGKIRLSDLHDLYPQAQVEDTAMLDRVEEIIERARFKARSRTPMPSDKESLLARAVTLSDELALAKLDLSNYAIFSHKLRSRIKQLSESASPETMELLHSFAQWVEKELPKAADIPPSQNTLLVQDTMLRLITAQIHIQTSGHEFLLEGNTTILEAGLSAGFALNYGCSNGNCGKCRAKLIKGQTKQTRNYDYSFTEAEKLQDYFLMCSHTALTDLIIDAEEAGDSRDIPQQTISAKVKKIEPIDKDVIILNIKTPRTNRLRFLAGQRAKLTVNKTLSIELPIASCPCDDMNIQFHIPMNSEPVNTYIANTLKIAEEVTIEGPAGEFLLDDDASNPLILIAQDTGFAPIKSLVEHALTLAHAENIKLYWFTSKGRSHYMRNQCRAWVDAFDSLEFIECNEEITDVPKVFSKTLQQKQISTSHVYIAGNQEFLQQCEKFFESHTVQKIGLEEV